MSAAAAVLSHVSHLVTRANVTTSQSGVLGGANPTTFDVNNPITLFIIQLALIMSFTQLLGVIFAKLRQPRVIAEVIGGILLGPTVFGRVPGFTNDIFPKASLSYLNLVSTIGLVLFLFLVGLEVDVSVIKKNYRASLSISLAGMILPFGLGAAIAVPLYNNFINTASVSFGHFLLFVGTAMSITAFPVLCRILTECKLLDTTVGTIVLAAGVGNDVVGWVLLALTVALVNAAAGGKGSGVTAVYILILAVAWTVLICWPVRKGFYWLAVRSGSIENGRPTPFMMTLTLFLVFASAFYTDIIGVHPIFGGFIAAFAIPHEGGFAIALVEKIEDLVTILFLPLYFTLSGLKTNLGLLDNGITWGYTILLCVVAFVGKFLGCAGAARLNRFGVRESLAVGTLMSCKGLVELIVLNVGLSAGILDQRVFSMFVFMAIILTVLTTPLTLLVYPSRYRDSLAATRATRKPANDSAASDTSIAGVRILTSKILVVLNRMDHLPAVMTVLQLLKLPGVPDTKKAEKSRERQIMEVDALRLVELTGRMSADMQSAEQESILRRDTIMQVFKTFGQLNEIPVAPYIAVVPSDSFTSLVVSHAEHSQMVVLPWDVPSADNPSEELDPSLATPGSTPNPFASLFGSSAATGAPLYSHFLRRVFSECVQDVGLFVHRGAGSLDFAGRNKRHFLVPFFGGADDRLALALVAQFCAASGVTATVLRVRQKDEVGSALSPSESTSHSDVSDDVKEHKLAMEQAYTVGRSGSMAQAIDLSTNMRLSSQAADEMAWSHFSHLRLSSTGAHPVMSFETITSVHPLRSIIDKATLLATTQPLVIVAGRGRRGGSTFSHEEEVATILSGTGQTPSVGAEMRKTMGDVATAAVVAGPATASFFVVQSGSGSEKAKSA